MYFIKSYHNINHEKSYYFKGFTLLELIIALAVTSILVLGISRMYQVQERTASQGYSIIEAMNQLRNAKYTIKRDLEKSGYNSRCSCFDRIVSATSTVIEISHDINEDGDIADEGENIKYSYTIGGNLLTSKRKLSDSLEPFLENVNNFEIKYYNDYFTESSATEVYNPALNEDEILKIKVTIILNVVEPTKVAADYVTRKVVFSVYPRNIL